MLSRCDGETVAPPTPDGPKAQQQPPPQQQPQTQPQTQPQPQDKRSKTTAAATTQLSKKLCWVLRHKCIELGLAMTPDGYVAVDELLMLDQFRNNKSNNNKNNTNATTTTTSLEEIQSVVTHCKKQRFKLRYDTTTNRWYIRANQGHSIANVIDVNQLLTPISPSALVELFPIVVHGTSVQAWTWIQIQGLSRMSRTHIHFATGLPTEVSVISGMRKNCQVYIYINTKKCAEDGILFYRSENNVILTAGVDEQGILPTSYFAKVTDHKGNIIEY